MGSNNKTTNKTNTPLLINQDVGGLGTSIFLSEALRFRQAISHLTGGQCSGWTGFSLNSLFTPFQVLYRVCELNWLPGSDTDSMMKNRLRLLYAVAKRKPIDFGHLVYDQVIEVTRKTDWDTNLIFPKPHLPTLDA
ncbi:unnamed protein product, partial [Brassica oleracea var. botrytis]